MAKHIAIVEDEKVIAENYRDAFQKQGYKVSVYEDRASAMADFDKELPDLAVIDISLAGDNGLDLVKEISSSNKRILILVLSMHDESVWAERAIRAGAKGYIMKKEASESIISAMKDVLAGKIRVSAAVTSQLLDKFHVKPDCQGAETVDILTDRELEVFRLIGSGLSTREIAERMNLGVKTIGTYRDRIKQKLHIKGGAELTRKAVLWTEQECFPTS